MKMRNRYDLYALFSFAFMCIWVAAAFFGNEFSVRIYLGNAIMFGVGSIYLKLMSISEQISLVINERID